MLFGVLRLGFLANFLSHPVIAGFITASGILIATSQLKHILGISAHGHTLPEMLASVLAHLSDIKWITGILGVTATAFLFWVRKGLKPLMKQMGASATVADFATKARPVAAVVATTVSVWLFGLDAQGVKIVGGVPQSLPPLTLPGLSPGLIQSLLIPAVLISVIGFIESVSVAQNARGQEAGAHRPGPGSDSISRGEYRRSLYWRSPGYRWLFPVGSEL
jgi:sulfate permease, SulP family